VRRFTVPTNQLRKHQDEGITVVSENELMRILNNNSEKIKKLHKLTLKSFLAFVVYKSVIKLVLIP
jgi:hypothetical protein